VDAHRSPAADTLQSFDESKPPISQAASSTSDHHSERLLIENGDVNRTDSGANIAAPPRKRIKHDCSSSTQDSVVIRIADGVTATAQPVSASTIFTPAAATVTTPSLCLGQALPLSGRIIGTVWQPVQSQSTATAVCTNNGIALAFCFASRFHSRKHNVMVWRLSVCLSVLSAYGWLVGV